MDASIARTAMVRSEISSGARDDGFDYADYQADKAAWAKMVWDIAGTNLEGYLFLAAAADYREHVCLCENEGSKPMARGKYIEHHVAGQIDRAIQIADGL